MTKFIVIIALVVLFVVVPFLRQRKIQKDKDGENNQS
jgi:hypothetical protein